MDGGSIENQDNISTSEKQELSLYDSIKLLEDRIKELKSYQFVNKWRYEYNINELNNLEKQLQELKKIQITKGTKKDIQSYILTLNAGLRKGDFDGNQVTSINKSVYNEKLQRKDTIDVIGKLTMRDYIEKYVKFEGVLNSIRENKFMTKFYDTLTVNYLDYIQNSKNKFVLEPLHKDLNSKTGIILSEQEIKDLIKLTIVKILENGLDIEDVKLDILLIGGKSINIDLGKMKLKKIFEIDNKKTNHIIENINRLSSDSNVDDINKLDLLIQKLEEYRNNIVTKYTNKKEKITIQNLKDLLTKKTIQILNEKSLNIKNNISSTTVKSYEEIYTLFKSIRNQINDFKNIKEKLKIDDTKFNIKELEINVNLEELRKILGIMNISNIKSIREEINEKIKQFLIYNNDGDFIGQVNRVKFLQKIEKFKDELNEKLLYIYLGVSGIESIKDRSNISSPELLTILRNAINEGEIDLETMSEIIKKGYTIAFLEEFNGINKEQILKNLKDNELKWKKIFRKELGSEIGEENAEKLYILSFIESNAMPSKESEYGAIGRFQILPSTAEPIIYEDTEMVKEVELSIKRSFKKSGKRYLNTKISKEDIIKYILNDPVMSAKIAARYLKYLIQLVKDKYKSPENVNIDLVILNALFLYNGRFTERLKIDNKGDEKPKIERLDDQGDEKENKNEKNDLRTIINKIFDGLNSTKNELSNGELNVKDAIKKIKIIDNSNFNKKISKGESNFQILDDHKVKQLTKKDIIDWIDKYTKEILNQQYSYPEQVKAANDAFEELKKTNNFYIKN